MLWQYYVNVFIKFQASQHHPLFDPNYQKSHSTQIIKIEKCLPTLGLVIEGGVDTQQPLARIISIHPDGAAFHNGQLKVGEIIQQVDNIELHGT